MNFYAVKTPNGKLILDSIARTKFETLENISGCHCDGFTLTEDDAIFDLYFRGTNSKDATMKRFYRAGWTIVPVTIVEGC